MQDPDNHFNSRNIYISIPKIFPSRVHSIKYIWLHLTRVIQIPFHISVFTFFEKKYRWSRSEHSSPAIINRPPILNNKDLFIRECLPEAIIHLHPYYGSWTSNPMPLPLCLSKATKWGLSGQQLSRDWSLQDTQEGDGITLSLNCSEEELQTPGWEAFHRCTEPMSSLSSSLVHAIRKDVPNPKIERSETISPAPVKVRTLHVPSGGDTLPRWLMHLNSPFTSTNVVHLPDSLE